MEIIKPRLSLTEKHRAMRWMAQQIQEAAGRIDGENGDTPLNEWEAHLAAARLSLQMVQIMTEKGEQGAAFFDEEENATFQSMILESRGLCGRRRARHLVHETAHYLMRHRVAPEIYRADAVIVTHEDADRERHRLACRVEDSVFD